MAVTWVPGKSCSTAGPAPVTRCTATWTVPDLRSRPAPIRLDGFDIVVTHGHTPTPATLHQAFPPRRHHRVRAHPPAAARAGGQDCDGDESGRGGAARFNLKPSIGIMEDLQWACRPRARLVESDPVHAAIFVARATAAAYGTRPVWSVLRDAGRRGDLTRTTSGRCWQSPPGAMVLMFANLACLRLSVGPDGIRYRTLCTRRRLCSRIPRSSGRISRPSVEPLRPTGVVSFWVQPEEAGAEYQSAQPSPHRVRGPAHRPGGARRPADVPDTGAGQRLVRDIRGLPGQRPRSPAREDAACRPRPRARSLSWT